MRPPLLVCPVLRCHCCPVMCLVYIVGILHGTYRILIGLLWDSHLVDDDDNVAVVVDVAAVGSDDAHDDDDNGHDGDDHQCHHQVIHMT